MPLLELVERDVVEAIECLELCEPGADVWHLAESFGLWLGIEAFSRIGDAETRRAVRSELVPALFAPFGPSLGESAARELGRLAARSPVIGALVGLCAPHPFDRIRTASARLLRAGLPAEEIEHWFHRRLGGAP